MTQGAASEDLVVEGQVVAGRYRVERVLGRGGMGVVVAARHLELDEVFALKVMTAGAFESEDAVERFVREARMSAKLRSQHAVRIHDAGRLPNGAPYLAMEHLSGRDLEKELDARGPIPSAEAATYIMQACDVLGEAHSMGIVHRDLKPGNLFLTRLPNGAPCIKVLDFGIAKQGDALAGARMTQTTAVFGTPLYMSPEQMKSARSVDARADIWSLGVVLYELVTGGVPFDASTMTELVAKVYSEPPILPSVRRGSVSPDIEPVIMRCLERDPEKRYPSARALWEALAPIAAGRPSALPPAPAQGSGPVPAQPRAVTAPPGGAYAQGAPSAMTAPPGMAYPQGAPPAMTAPPGMAYPQGASPAMTAPPGQPQWSPPQSAVPTRLALTPAAARSSSSRALWVLAGVFLVLVVAGGGIFFYVVHSVVDQVAAESLSADIPPPPLLPPSSDDPPAPEAPATASPASSDSQGPSTAPGATSATPRPSATSTAKAAPKGTAKPGGKSRGGLL